MTIVLPLLPLKYGIALPGTAAVSGLATTISEVAGTSAGIIVAVVGVVGLMLGIARGNRERRREYLDEIAAAEARGAERYRSQMEPWIQIAVQHLASQGIPLPPPPVVVPPTPIRRRSRRADDQAGEP